MLTHKQEIRVLLFNYIYTISAVVTESEMFTFFQELVQYHRDYS